MSDKKNIIKDLIIERLVFQNTRGGIGKGNVSILKEGVDKDRPLGDFDPTKGDFIWNDKSLDTNAKVDAIFYDFSGESEWIMGIEYDEDLGLLTWHFNSLTTNGKPSIIQGLLQPVPVSFVSAVLDAPSKGAFYLQFVALYKTLRNGTQIENKTSQFKPLEIGTIIGFNDEEEGIPSRVSKGITRTYKTMYKMNNDKNFLKKTIEQFGKKQFRKLAKKGIEKISYKEVFNDDVISREAQKVLGRLFNTKSANKRQKIINSDKEMLKEIGKIKQMKDGSVIISTAKGRKLSGPTRSLTRTGKVIKTTARAIKTAKALRNAHNTMVELNKKVGKGEGGVTVLEILGIKRDLNNFTKNQIMRKSKTFKGINRNMK